MLLSTILKMILPRKNVSWCLSFATMKLFESCSRPWKTTYPNSSINFHESNRLVRHPTSARLSQSTARMKRNIERQMVLFWRIRMTKVCLWYTLSTATARQSTTLAGIYPFCRAAQKQSVMIFRERMKAHNKSLFLLLTMSD